MKYLTIFLVFIFSSAAFAQTDNKGQSIELPDFVITGVQSLDVPIVKKKKAELVPTISEEFLTPTYSPEEFSLSAPSSYIGKKIDLFESVSSFEGGLKIGAGQHTLPIGEFHFAQNFDNYLFSARAYTKTIKDYIDNAGYQISGGSISNDFYIDTDSEFLPGTKISLAGEYYRDSYKFFGSTVTPTLERKTQNGSANLVISNVYGNLFNFGLDFGGRYFTLSDNDFNESVFTGKVFGELKFLHFGVRVDGKYKIQALKNNPSSVNDYNYYNGKITLKIAPSNALNVSLGAFYSKTSDDSFVMPVASFNFRLDKNLIMFGSFAPYSELLTITDFATKNRFFDLSNVDNVLLKDKTNLQLAVKYEFEKYFELNAGVKYSMFDNFLYFEDTALTGKFDVKTENDVKSISAFMNAIFHVGPMGEFYGKAIVQQVTDSNGDFMPYQPVIISSLAYAYNFEFGLGFKLRYDAALNIHADRTTFTKINDYHNLTCEVNFKLSDNFEVMAGLENIMNKENYILQNYKDKPFDIIGGIYYHW